MHIPLFLSPPTETKANVYLFWTILGSKTAAWSGKKSTKWHQWTSFHITCPHMVTHTPNSTFTRHSLLICPHRTRGIVFRILDRDSISFIKANNIKDTKTIRTVRRMHFSVAAVVILKSILKSSDLKTTPVASTKQLMSWVESHCAWGWQ